MGKFIQRTAQVETRGCCRLFHKSEQTSTQLHRSVRVREREMDGEMIDSCSRAQSTVSGQIWWFTLWPSRLIEGRLLGDFWAVCFSLLNRVLVTSEFPTALSTLIFIITGARRTISSHYTDGCMYVYSLSMTICDNWAGSIVTVWRTPMSVWLKITAECSQPASVKDVVHGSDMIYPQRA